MKHRSFLGTVAKIVLLSSIFFGVFQIWNYVFTDTPIPMEESLQSEGESTSDRISNATRFQSAYSSQFGVIGVALSTRIGMTYSELGDSDLNSRRFYTGINSMPSTGSERRQVRQRLLEENMIFIREYFNVSQTDIINALSSSSDRARTLDNFVNQIELRRDGSEKSIENLQSQRQLYITELNSITQAINIERSTLEREFNKGNARDTLRSSDNFISLRTLETEIQSDLVYMNQFIRQYAFLNDYNVGIVNTLKSNRQQIIDRTFIVLPNTGNEFLRPLELLRDQDDLD